MRKLIYVFLILLFLFPQVVRADGNFFAKPAAVSGNEWLGYTAGTNEDLPSNAWLVCSAKITPTTTGHILVIRVYYEGGAGGNIKWGFYTDVAGTPTSLVATEQAFAIGAYSQGWHDFTLSPTIPVTGSQSYWPCFSIDTNNGIGIWSGTVTAGRYVGSQTYSDPWPATFTGGASALEYNIQVYNSW
jgi:hypothetical protein